MSRETMWRFIFLRNHSPRVAKRVAALVAIATGLVFALNTILDEGGGSLAGGWSPGWAYLSFYGFFMLPIVVVVGLVAMGLSRLIGGGIVMVVAMLGLGSLVIRTVVSSTPAARLAGVTGSTLIPDLNFEQFAQGHTYGDGTSYRWIIRCAPDEAKRLVDAAGLKAISSTVGTKGSKGMLEEHPAVRDYRAIFETKVDGVEVYADGRGMIGGYSAGEGRFRLFWWPEMIRGNDDQ